MKPVWKPSLPTRGFIPPEKLMANMYLHLYLDVYVYVCVYVYVYVYINLHMYTHCMFMIGKHGLSNVFRKIQNYGGKKQISGLG